MSIIKADMNKKRISIALLCGVFMILVIGSVIWVENFSFSEKISNTYPVMIRVDGHLYIQDSISEYGIIDIKNNRISFVAEGHIETVTSEYNSYPRENNQTNFEGIVGYEYAHINGELYLLYKNQLVRYVEYEHYNNY
ncbi:MAG: hypothetical protein K6E47_16215 [Lachnospiraceae bacterium]|nr:hypothetical protein [Lachnospiraceae bacterium]